MPSVEFFQSLGLYTNPAFLDPTVCARIHKEALEAPVIPGTIYRYDKGEILDETKRRSVLVQLSDETRGFIEAHLHDLTPHLEKHFRVSLTGHELPKISLYRQGDFVAPHLDVSRNEDAPAHFRRRQVSTVLFISDPLDYTGGALVLYGLVDHGPWRSRGFQLESTPGLLVAFPSTLVHEVQSIVEGERVTITTFFF